MPNLFQAMTLTLKKVFFHDSSNGKKNHSAHKDMNNVNIKSFI